MWKNWECISDRCYTITFRRNPRTLSSLMCRHIAPGDVTTYLGTGFFQHFSAAHRKLHIGGASVAANATKTKRRRGTITALHRPTRFVGVCIAKDSLFRKILFRWLCNERSKRLCQCSVPTHCHWKVGRGSASISAYLSVSEDSPARLARLIFGRIN